MNTLHISITFQQKGSTLAQYEYAIEKPEEFRTKIDAAHDRFRKEFPDIMLFDGVNVIYDTVK
jgi:hypothetical protein